MFIVLIVCAVLLVGSALYKHSHHPHNVTIKHKD